MGPRGDPASFPSPRFPSFTRRDGFSQLVLRIEGAGRGVLHAGVLALAAAAALWAKYAWITTFLRQRWLLTALVVGFGILAVVLWRVLRAPAAPALGVAFLLGGFLLASVVNTPLTYEMAHAVEDVPFPDGASEIVVLNTRARAAGHPEALVEARYPPTTNATTLAHNARSAFEADGWTVAGFVAPGEDPQRWGQVGFFSARDDVFSSTCTVSPPPEFGGVTRITCTVSA